MRRLRIDFAPGSLGRSILRTGPWTWLLLAAGVVLCGSAAMTAHESLGAIAAVDAETLSIERKASARTALHSPPPETRIAQTQAEAVNAAIAQLNLPWRDILGAIESATPSTVALLALDPDAGRHVIKGLAEARNSDGMIDYLQQLKRQPFLDDVVLLKHETNEQDPNRPLRFQFEAHWVEGAR